MRNRWFHAPVLHSPVLGGEKKVTWLELFYDLIFVAAFIQLGNGLSRYVSLEGFLGFAAVFTPMWVAWTGFTLFINRFTVDDFTHRLIVFVQMFAVGAMAVTASDVLDGDPHTFAISYALAQAIVAVLYLRSWRQVPEARAYSRYWGSVFGIGAVLWGLSALVPTPYNYGLWALGLIEVLVAPVRRQSRQLNDQYPWDHEHLAERYGLLTLIVLGESFVKVISTLGEGSGTTGILQASFTLLITCCLWWIYFDDVAGSRIKNRRLNPVIWLYAHLPLQIGAVAVGVAIKKAVHFDLGAVAPDAYRWLLSGALALTFASVSLIDSVTERRQAELSDRLRVNVRFGSAVLILLLAPAGAGMSAAVFVGLVTSVCLAQVVFDMMMAPFEAESEHHERESVGDVVRRRQAGDTASTHLPRPRVGQALRKGTPSEMRRDIYFYFMEGGWFRFLASLLFVFVMINVFFAALYFLQPGSIDAVRPSSFADAFFFSVQTLATIGYGVMHPVSEYGHAVVTAQAAVGMLFVAVITGLTFAKVSRPRASVLFSEVAVVTTMDGMRTLVFRAGNARGNDVIDASMTVTALIDEVSAEGQHLRRLHDLRLVRSSSPVFTLTWVVMHPIDEDSPLARCSVQPGGDLVTIIVTMTGHDGTYGQTIYARHSYYPEDVIEGHRFVDVISQLPDGRMLVDYTHFHDTVVDTVTPAGSG